MYKNFKVRYKNTTRHHKIIYKMVNYYKYVCLKKINQEVFLSMGIKLNYTDLKEILKLKKSGEFLAKKQLYIIRG